MDDCQLIWNVRTWFFLTNCVCVSANPFLFFPTFSLQLLVTTTILTVSVSSSIYSPCMSENMQSLSSVPCVFHLTSSLNDIAMGIYIMSSLYIHPLEDRTIPYLVIVKNAAINIGVKSLFGKPTSFPCTFPVVT